ncbi:MAG: ABC transporter permease [Patescibacteria group bacterium]
MIQETKIPFFLVWRFLKRGNKWTFLLIIFLMAIAFINLVFITSLFSGIVESANSQIIDTYTGHVSISPVEGEKFIPHATEEISRIDATPGVEAASAQVFLPASLTYKNRSGNWSVIAIDPAAEKEVTNVAAKMTAGSYLDPADTDQIIIGRQIAGGEGVEMNAFSFKGATVGERVTLSLNGQTKEFTIKGIFYTKFIDTDQRAFITRGALNELAPTYDDVATNIVIRITTKGEEQLVVDRLQKNGVTGTFYTWKDVAGLMATVTNSFVLINALLTSVGILIAAVTIFIVIYIDISSKRQQIGVLRAIGIKSYLIRSTYVIQTAVYSVFGVLLGLGILFGFLIPYFNAHPFQLPIGDATLAVSSVDLIFRTELIIWVAILSGLIPAFIITRVKMLDAIFNR